MIEDSRGGIERFDHVVIATHATRRCACWSDPTPQERSLLGAFRYIRNRGGAAQRRQR